MKHARTDDARGANNKQRCLPADTDSPAARPRMHGQPSGIDAGSGAGGDLQSARSAWLRSWQQLVHCAIGTNRALAVEAGAIDAVLAVMWAHSKNASVSAASCCALQVVCSNGEFDLAV